MSTTFADFVERAKITDVGQLLPVINELSCQISELAMFDSCETELLKLTDEVLLEELFEELFELTLTLVFTFVFEPRLRTLALPLERPLALELE